MAKRRRFKKSVRYTLIVFFVILLALCLLFSGKAIRWAKVKLGYYPDYSKSTVLDLELNSDKYLLYCVDTNKVIYANRNAELMYPASLTKVFTMDAVLKSGVNLDDTSYFSGQQRNELIEENASLAYLNADADYSLRDLLYGLILPSGADAALALENYYEDRDDSIFTYFDSLHKELELVNTSFVNTTGLHSEEHYTTLDDLLLVVRDVLKNPDGYNVLTTMEHYTEDGVRLRSSLRGLGDLVLGGKTGYTGEAGENLIALFELEDDLYVLLLGNANGNPYAGQNYHFEDCERIIDFLRGGE